jgi:hypothetical protein
VVVVVVVVVVAVAVSDRGGREEWALISQPIADVCVCGWMWLEEEAEEGKTMGCSGCSEALTHALARTNGHTHNLQSDTQREGDKACVSE